MTSILRQFPLFESLCDKDLEILERIMIVQDHRAGHVYVREGDRATAVTASMYVILEGQVEIIAKAPAGGFGVRRRMGPGDLFGAVAFVSDTLRTATVQAAGKVKTARLDRRTFDALYKRDAGVHARFQLIVAHQLAKDIRATQDLLAKAIESGNIEPLAARFG